MSERDSCEHLPVVLRVQAPLRQSALPPRPSFMRLAPYMPASHTGSITVSLMRSQLQMTPMHPLECSSPQ